MSVNRLQLDGLDALRQALRDLPEHLAVQAAEIVTRTADETGATLQTNYPEGRTGHLRGGVRVEHDRSRQQARATVRSSAQHASLYEFGTKRRTTTSGANRGSMPQAPENRRLIPLAIRARRSMTNQLIALVESFGLQVEQS